MRLPAPGFQADLRHEQVIPPTLRQPRDQLRALGKRRDRLDVQHLVARALEHRRESVRREPPHMCAIEYALIGQVEPALRQLANNSPM